MAGHFDVPQGGRQVALLGDAELDEGAIWEAVIDPLVSGLGEVLWVIDVNRQSLDRVVPEITVGRMAAMFEAAGWHTITVKYGRRLRALFERPGGEALRGRIDGMPNEEYQLLLRLGVAELRERLPGAGRSRGEIERLLSELDDGELAGALRDLAGHDLQDLSAAFRSAEQIQDRPTVIFAYTIKAWGLPTEGHPANHSALLSGAQWQQLAVELGADAANPWAPFAEGSPEARLCNEAALRLGVMATTKLIAEGGREGVEAVHGVLARWMEWHGQLDETLRRVIIRFENNPGPLHWFVRRNYPLAAFPVQFDRNLTLAPDATLNVDHTLTFTALP